MQRALIQYRDPKNYDLVHEALLKAGRADLIGFGEKCLIRPRKPKTADSKGTPSGGKGKAPAASGKGKAPAASGKEKASAARGNDKSHQGRKPAKTIRNVHKKK